MPITLNVTATISGDTGGGAGKKFGRDTARSFQRGMNTRAESYKGRQTIETIAREATRREINQ